MSRLWVFCALLVCSLPFLGPLPALAQPPSTELVIFGEGDDVFSRYGHVGIRVFSNDRDQIYNFGITNWERPNYVLDFLQGRVRFYGKASNWGRELARYTKWDRSVTRYPLQLDEAARAELVKRLDVLVLPENREYVYDTFRENCSTRLRDLLDQVTGGAVRRQLEGGPPGDSFRDDVRRAFADFPALLLLMEVVPGRELDRPRHRWERTYRPAVLGELLSKVRMGEGDTERTLLGAPIVERTRKAGPALGGFVHLGQAVLFALAGLLVFLGSRSPRWTTRGRSLVALTVLALMCGTALVLSLVPVISAWPEMRENWLLLALPPLDLVLFLPVVRLWRRGEVGLSRGFELYLAVRAATTLLLIALAPVSTTFAGPIAAECLALAGLFLLWRTLRSSYRG